MISTDTYVLGPGSENASLYATNSCKSAQHILNQTWNVCAFPPLNSDLQEIVVENGEVSQTAETLLDGSGIANKQSYNIIILNAFFWYYTLIVS